MARYEDDRSIDEHYDEWCTVCQDYTEHSMGQCLECEQRTPASKPARLKKKIATKRDDSSEENA